MTPELKNIHAKHSRNNSTNTAVRVTIAVAKRGGAERVNLAYPFICLSSKGARTGTQTGQEPGGKS